ncbi:MAG: hypothetical protein ACYS1A_06850 [Planctomycetota bacterium]
MKTRKNPKLRKLYWSLAALTAALIIFILLLLYTPVGFDQPVPINDGKLSRYLTHELAPRFYNGAQRQQPFDLIITQAGLNDIIARCQWPKDFDTISISTPKLFFVPDNIVLMTTASFHGLKFIVTVTAAATIDEDGLLHLSLAKVKVGAVRMTFIARPLAKRIYKKNLGDMAMDPQNIWSQLAASLLAAQPFEPVLTAEDKKVRAEKITITPANLTVNFVPAPD